MYEQFYKLTVKPFALNPDPKFFFGSRGHNEAMSYLRYGQQQGEGIVVITGDMGTGKTLLARNLLVELAKENVVAAHLGAAQLDPDEMLHMVAASFGIPHEGKDKAALLRELENFFTRKARERRRLLLIVDNAHSLSARSLEELRMLSNFELEGRILLQTYLIGQPALRGTLQSPGMEQLRQRVIAAYHLNPLGVDEIRGYIEHRLRLAGWQGIPRLHESCFGAIHAITGGVPRRINQLCERLLLFGYLEELKEFGAAEVWSTDQEIRNEISMITLATDAADATESPRPDAGQSLTEGAGKVVTFESRHRPNDLGGRGLEQSAPPAGARSGNSRPNEYGDDRTAMMLERLQKVEEQLRALDDIVARQQGYDHIELMRRIDEIQEQVNMLVSGLRRGRQAGE